MTAYEIQYMPQLSLKFDPTKELLKMAKAASLEAEAPSLEAEAPVTEEAAGDTPGAEINEEDTTEQPDTSFSFEVDNYDKPVTGNLKDFPTEVRMHLLRNAVRSYVLNRVTTAASMAKKANEPWTSYEAAQANDALQTVVPKPDTEKTTVDYAGIIERAITALKTNEIGKRGKGEGKSKLPKDPLNAQITRTIVSEIFQKRLATDPNYKYFTAQKEVGPDGLAYMHAKIEENVREYGADREQQMAVLQAQYIKPAKIMLGMEPLQGKLKDADSIL